MLNILKDTLNISGKQETLEFDIDSLPIPKCREL